MNTFFNSQNGSMAGQTDALSDISAMGSNSVTIIIFGIDIIQLGHSSDHGCKSVVQECLLKPCRTLILEMSDVFIS